ncbi:MCE family protein [Gordonia pseudamarae]|jgi:phospholipid/cholesterol/gamma-HCH transport system substrate-binding protein|uniref:MCE family protein n=1 Tax=Gordonia pseudamarae TaxID=2831662 RepID=A0ABX6IFM2_9ACTN|nr:MULTISPECIES: MCE family protein [Gordonia]MBD0021557.1 MCE family protein [Gordonia sp. (in: high G+C Gram-positive bacteria)]QHN25152.1 MCE family protein [Gordonia pseudamarae]QHN34085.1 MCE family protein [Gordonia pseudamarae]
MTENNKREGLFTAHRSESDDADVARVHKRGGRGRAAVGAIGIIVVTLVVVSAMQMDKLPYLSPVSTYSAYFDDAGGLSNGDVVMVSGVEVGAVEGIALAKTGNGTKVKVSFRMKDDVVVGNQSQAAIKTETVLGRRNLTIIPHGGDLLRPGDTIPIGQTSAPYSLQDALDTTSAKLQDTDTDQLNEALRTLTETFAETPAQVRGAVDGVARLSKAVNDRDTALRQLLTKADSVSSVVATRNKQIDTLLIDANSLLGEVQIRRAALGRLITGTRDLTRQLSGFIADNNEQLKPVQEKLRRVLTILTDKEKDLKQTIDRLGPYANSLGEAVASGPNFDSLVGIPTFGDYTSVFMKVLQRKYPQAFDSFLKYTQFPPLPSNWTLAPPKGSDPPRPAAPSPTYPTPAPPTDTATSEPPAATMSPRQGG